MREIRIKEENHHLHKILLNSLGVVNKLSDNVVRIIYSNLDSGLRRSSMHHNIALKLINNLEDYLNETYNSFHKDNS